MKRTRPKLNKVWGRALRAALMILPLGLNGCFDDKLPPAGSFDLAVSVSGSGQVTSSPGGIDCGSDNRGSRYAHDHSNSTNMT